MQLRTAFQTTSVGCCGKECFTVLVDAVLQRRGQLFHNISKKTTTLSSAIALLAASLSSSSSSLAFSKTDIHCGNARTVQIKRNDGSLHDGQRAAAIIFVTGSSSHDVETKKLRLVRTVRRLLTAPPPRFILFLPHFHTTTKKGKQPCPVLGFVASYLSLWSNW